MFKDVPAEILRAALERLAQIFENRGMPAYKKLNEAGRIFRIIREYRNISDGKDAY